MRMALSGGDVFNAVDGYVQKETNVVIDGKTILTVGRDPIPTDCTKVDARGTLIMPGLVDTHVHFAHIYTGYLSNRPGIRWGYISARTVATMQHMLSTGVTSARDLGGLDAGYVDAEEEGKIRAPRLAGNAVQFMMPTNGSFDLMPPWGGYSSVRGEQIHVPGLPDPHCDGPWECRKRVREVIRAGAEVIKIGSGGCLVARRYDHGRPTFTREEIDVFVDEGKRQRLPVHCHCFGGSGLEEAIAAGVSCIEHGAELDDRLLEQMATKNIWWVPTFWITDVHARLEPEASSRDFFKRSMERMRRNLERAKKVGVAIAMGSDGGMHDEGEVGDGNATHREVVWMAEGLGAADALISATRRGAELIGTADRIGTLEAGKEADLLVIEGDVLGNPQLLLDEHRRKLVLKAGEPVGGAWLRSEFPRAGVS